MQKEYITYPFPTRFTTPLAVAHVTIIPMDTDRLLVDQTLLIEGGRIVAMGPSSSFELPPGYAVVEGTGKYLMPGLADMHVHYSSPGDADLIDSVCNVGPYFRGLITHFDSQSSLRAAKHELRRPADPPYRPGRTIAASVPRHLHRHTC